MFKFNAIVISLLALVPAPSSGQLLSRFTNPEVNVQITHPPSLPLKVKTVAFGPPQGQCSETLHDRVESDFHASGAEVVDRVHLESVMAEHKLQVSGLVDSATASRLGEMLGAQALVFLKVLRCQSDKDVQRLTCRNYETKQDYTCHKYTTKTTLSGSLRVVDLTTGRVLAAQPFSGSAEESSQDGYPDGSHLIGQAESMAATSINRMFFPWRENRTLVFFDDKECNLKMASQLLKAGDYEGTLSESLQNLEACEAMVPPKPKVLMRAQYNVGLAHFIRGEHDKALEFFNEALRNGGGEIVTTAMADCRRAQQLSSAMVRYEEDRNALLSDLPSTDTVAPAESNAPSSSAASKAVASPAGVSVEDRLRKVDALLKQGLISQDEYKSKKAEILKDL